MSDLKARLEGLQHVWRQMAIQARKTERQGNAQQYMWACVEGAKAQILDQCADRLAALLVGEEPPADQPLWPYAPLPPQLQAKVEAWLVGNRGSGVDFYHGVFPLGMVTNWINRAERAEKGLLAASPRLGAAPPPTKTR